MVSVVGSSMLVSRCRQLCTKCIAGHLWSKTSAGFWANILCSWPSSLRIRHDDVGHPCVQGWQHTPKDLASSWHDKHVWSTCVLLDKPEAAMVSVVGSSLLASRCRQLCTKCIAHGVSI